MNTYHTELAPAGVRADCGNPELVDVYWLDEQGVRHNLCTADLADAKQLIIPAMELRDKLLSLAGDDALRDMQVVR